MLRNYPSNIRLFDKENEMAKAMLEHVNITVSDADKTAKKLCDLFDWKIRWQGSAMNGDGHTVHVGTDDDYLAIYQPQAVNGVVEDNYHIAGALNHIGLVVDDLDAMETKVKSAGYTPTMHADYEPGRRFYFHMEDNVEVELVSYG